MLRSAARFTSGFAIGIALWTWWAPQYNRAILPLAHHLARFDSRLIDLNYTVTGRSVDFWGGTLPPGRFPMDLLSYNLILLAALFALNRPFFARRNLIALAISLAILVVTHIVAAAVSIIATYATRSGEWSTAHYSPFEQDLWMALEYVYRLAGMFAVAFALWWAFRPGGENAT